MMGLHRGDEISIDVATRLRGHVIHHLRHGDVVFLEERGFLGSLRGWRSGRMRLMRKRQRLERQSDDNPCA
jgi:hypothetical protein